jgi:DNA-binding PadR family transcriptional regulator
VQDVVLALLAKEPSHGYELRRRLAAALGPLGEALNAGQIYVTLTRLEKTGLVVREREDTPVRGPRRKVYGLTAAGRERVAAWMAEGVGPRADLTEFHLKLVAAAESGLADPLVLVDTRRRELMRDLAEAQHAALAHDTNSEAGLLLEGIALRLQADLRWLVVCGRTWSARTARTKGNETDDERQSARPAAAQGHRWEPGRGTHRPPGVAGA